MIDLLVYVPDTHIENAIQALLKHKTKALNIRDIDFKILRCPYYDPGVYKTTATQYHTFKLKHKPNKLLVLLDDSWESNPGTHIVYKTICDNIQRAGVTNNDYCVIIIKPEIEQWIWTHNPEPFAKVFDTDNDGINKCAKIYNHSFGTKPKDPKEMLNNFRIHFKQPISAKSFETFALYSSWKHCNDESFLSLVKTLQEWFPSNRPY